MRAHANAKGCCVLQLITAQRAVRIAAICGCVRGQQLVDRRQPEGDPLRSRLEGQRLNPRARAALRLWLCAFGALLGASCKAKLPDGVFVCASDDDCPSGFRCRESLCRRGGASELATSTDAATPSESMVSPDAAPTSGNTASGSAGERSAPTAGAGGESAKDAGPKVVPPPPPPAFTPHTFVPLPSGRSITAGGAYMQSSNYRLWTAVGQAPGTGYPVRSSENHRLLGGIVGVLQSETR